MPDFHTNERLLFGAIFGVFVVLTAVIAVIPAMRVQSSQEPLPSSEPMSELERKGLQVYVDEGCAYCHTQQVRPVPSDESLGRPSVAADYARLERPGVWRQTPAVLGSERTGPDLSNVAERQPSEQWHYMHLYNPRAVVSDSVMPSFRWLFRVEEDPPADATTVSMPGSYGPEEGTVVPNERGRALVAYLKTLKQDPLPEGAGGEGSSSAADKGAAGGAEGATDGKSVYENKCASCHQSNGKGIPGNFPPLAGDPVVTADDPERHVEIIVNGLEGKTIDGTDYEAAMPPFGGQLSDDEIAAVVNHERTSWGNEAPTVTPEEVAEIRSALEDAESDEE